MKLKIKHYYFNDDGWTDIKAILRNVLIKNPQLDKYDSILLTHEKDKDLALEHPFLNIEEVADETE